MAALLLAAVVLPLAVTAAAAWMSWREVWRETQAEMERAAGGAAEYARRVLDSHRMAVDRVNDLLRGLSDEEIRAREAELHAALRSLIKDTPQAQTAYVLDRTGHLLVSAGTFPVMRDLSFTDREHHHLLAVADAPPVVVTRIYAGRTQGNVFFAVARRRRDTGNAGITPGEFDGQANVAVSPREVGESLRRLARQPGDSLALIRADGEVLARSLVEGDPPPFRLAPDNAILQRMAGGEELAVASGASPVDGVRRIAAWRKVEGWPVYAVAGRPHATVLARWRRSLATQIAVGVPATLALLGLALLVRRAQYRLVQANEGLERRVAERTAALAESEARLRHVQRVGRVGGFEIDLRTGVNRRSAEYMQVQGRLPEAALEAHEDWVRRLHPEDRDSAERLFFEAVADGTPNTEYAQEYRIVTPQGETRWIAARAEITRDATGRALGMVGAHMDITELKMAQLALAEGEARLRAALRGARLGTWERHLPSGAASWDARATEIYGGLTPEAAAPDFAEWRARIHPEDRATRLTAIEAAIAPGGPDSYDAEFRFRRNDGGWNRVAIHGAVVERDPLTGRGLRLAGVVQDVTAQRAQEAQQWLLMRELDHRAKNALAVVQAALRLTPKSDAASYAAAVGGRVAALARAHTLLAAGRWQGTELRSLVEAELASFLPEATGDAPSRALLEGPPLSVTPGAAQALSMAVHELATNAVKYGALSVPGGRLRVTWQPDFAAGLLQLVWQESGGPPITAPPGRRGFGSRVIMATIRDQLGGTVERDWQAGGLVCRLTLPLDRILPQEGAGDELPAPKLPLSRMA